MFALAVLATLFGVSLSFPNASYCNGGPVSSDDANLGGVAVSSLSGPILDDQSDDCPGVIGINERSETTTLQIGEHYFLSWQVTTCGKWYRSSSTAWIDFNRNGLFESREQLGSTHQNDVPKPDEVVTEFERFIVPADASEGATQLRVMVQEGGFPTLDPCGTFPYGAMKTYNIEIRSSPPSPPPSYCFGGPTLSDDTNLGAVYLAGLDDGEGLDDSSDDCPGVIGINERSETTSLKIGGLYVLSWQVTTCGQWYPSSSTAWIDFNRNGLFESQEQLGSTHQNGVPEPDEVVTEFEKFIVPADASEGATQLRIMVQEGGFPTLDPCGTFPYGAMKTYDIVIHQPSSL